VKERCDYLPFGEEIQRGIGGRGTDYCNPVYPTGTPDIVSQKFTGQLRDAETGLDYFGARYFSGAQGRFTSPDEFNGGPVDPFTGQQIQQPGPLPYADITNPQSLNKYTYVLNNPLRYTDPDGHCVFAGLDTLACAAAVTATAAAGAGAIYYGKKLGEAIGAYFSQDQPPPTSKPQEQSTPASPPPPGGNNDKNKGRERTEHGQERAEQARSGDTHREVGDVNRVIEEGRQFRDTETGNTVHVSGDRAVVTNSEGRVVSQFKNTRANTLQRIKKGRWEPIQSQ
jgi:RHS repeat-associated protein